MNGKEPEGGAARPVRMRTPGSDGVTPPGRARAAGSGKPAPARPGWSSPSALRLKSAGDSALPASHGSPGFTGDLHGNERVLSSSKSLLQKKLTSKQANGCFSVFRIVLLHFSYLKN